MGRLDAWDSHLAVISLRGTTIFVRRSTLQPQRVTSRDALSSSRWLKGTRARSAPGIAGAVHPWEMLSVVSLKTLTRRKKQTSMGWQPQQRRKVVQPRTLRREHPYSS